jgi:hypothetical protein
MINQYSFNFEDLAISRGEVESFMGYEIDGSPEPIPGIIDEVIRYTPDYTDIKGGYFIIDDIVVKKDHGEIQVKEVVLKTERIITTQLRKAEAIALFICTAGVGIGDWSKVLMSEGDLLKGYIIDSIGSITVEKAMDLIQHKLEIIKANENLKITSRYSPGYCKWNVSEQHKLFSFFPEGFCGVHLNESALMHPIKSISGIIGIGKEVRKNPYTCDMCDSKNCLYRNRKM